MKSLGISKELSIRLLIDNFERRNDVLPLNPNVLYRMLNETSLRW